MWAALPPLTHTNLPWIIKKIRLAHSRAGGSLEIQALFYTFWPGTVSDRFRLDRGSHIFPYQTLQLRRADALLSHRSYGSNQGQNFGQVLQAGKVVNGQKVIHTGHDCGHASLNGPVFI